MRHIYKLEMEFDELKILSEHRYEISMIYSMIIKCLTHEGLYNEARLNFTYKCSKVHGIKKIDDICRVLYKASWFSPYVTKLTCYDLTDGKRFNLLQLYQNDEKGGV